MSTKVAQLSADLTANSSSFESNLGRADRKLLDSQKKWKGALAQTETAFNSLGGVVGKLTKGYGLLAGAVGAIAGTGFVMLARDSLRTASALKDTADRLQITTTELQRNQYAFKQSGVDAEKFETAITKLNAQIADGKLKYNNAAEALDSIAEAVENAKTGTERLAIVNDAFGNKLGAKMLPALLDGVDGLRALGDEAQRTGNVIDQDTIDKADRLADEFENFYDTIKKNLEGGFLQAFVGESGKLKDVYTDPKFGEGITEVGRTIGDITANLVGATAALGNFIIKYKELDEIGKKNLKNLDKRFFDMLDNLDRRMGRGALVDKRIEKNKPFGPAEPFGPSTGAFQAAGVPRPGSKPPTPYVFTSVREESDRAAEKALRDSQARAKTVEGIISGLREENDLLTIQTSMYGQKEAAMDKAQRALKIQNQLQAAGVQLTKQQQFAIKDYLDSIEQQNELVKEQAAQQKRLEEQERNRQEAIDQLGATFSSAFEDAIVSGNKLSDVLDGLLQDILRLVTRVAITAPLGNAITDYFSPTSGTSGGGFLSKLFGGLPSFDVGTNYVPRDMIAQIHKGEMIVPAYDANRVAGGGSSNVNVQIINNSNTKVTQQSQQTAQGTDLRIMVDEMVADNLRRPNTKTGQSVREVMGQGLIRR